MIAAVVYLLWDPDAMYEWMSGDVAFTPPPPCDLHTSDCNATLGDGRPVRFGITPRPVPVMTPLALTLVDHGLDRDELSVQIYGLNMNMGRYEYPLRRDENGTFRGKGMIPSCVGQMQWRINVIADYPTHRVGTYFTLTTE